jgi:hypothetical protein
VSLQVYADGNNLNDAGDRNVNQGACIPQSEFRRGQDKDSDLGSWSKAPSNAGRNSGRYTRSKTPGKGGSKALSTSQGQPESNRRG